MRRASKKLLRKALGHSSPGWISLDALTGMSVYLLLLPALYMLISMGLTELEKRVAAYHFNLIAHAAQEYGRSHAAELLAAAAANSGPVLTVDTLQEAGLLRDVSSRNPWGQGYQIYARQPAPGDLRLVVLTTGGPASSRRSFVNSVVPSTASMAGGHAGFIPSGLLPGQTTGRLQGSMGGWSLDLASVGIPSPGAGHLGALTDFSADELAGEYLYRVAVPGKPELNEMWTELDMTDHAVRNIQEIQFEHHAFADTAPCGDAEQEGRVFLDATEGLYVCREGEARVLADTGNSQLFKHATVVANNTLIDKPSCPEGTDTEPQIFVAPSILSADATSPPLAAVQAWATSESDTQWRVHVRVLKGDGKGWVYPGENYGRVTVMALCAGQ